MSALIDILADQAAELDEIADELLPLVIERIQVLISTPDERDPEVYALYGSEDADLGLADFAAVPRQDRDADWLERLASFVLAARMQAFAELVLPKLLEVSEVHGERADIAARKLDISEARQAAKEGISKDAVSVAARNRLAAKAQATEAAAAKELL